jgi:hypothetical protein
MNFFNYIYEQIGLLPLHCFEFINSFVLFYYLYAPKILGGHQGMPYLDICASELRLPSHHLTGDTGYAICDTSINNTVHSYTTAICFGLGLLLLFKLPPLLYLIYRELIDLTISQEERRRRREAARRGALTKRENEKKIQCLNYISNFLNDNGHLSPDDLLIGIRNRLKNRADSPTVTTAIEN